MSSVEIFGTYAEYYDLFYQDKNYKQEVAYVTSLVDQHARIPIKDVLDLGCGTGRHDVFLTNAGYAVTGVDLSPEMIALAQVRDSEQRRVYLKGDVRTASLDQQFDAVFSLFHVASYLTSEVDLESFMRVAYGHLKPGGIFIFDFWNAPAVVKDPPVVRKRKIETEQQLIVRESIPEIEAENNTIDVCFNLTVRDKASGQEHTFKEIHPMRYWFEKELQSMAIQQSFSSFHAFEWLKISPLSDLNWNGLCVLAKQ